MQQYQQFGSNTIDQVFILQGMGRFCRQQRSGIARMDAAGTTSIMMTGNAQQPVTNGRRTQAQHGSDPPEAVHPLCL
jgi:hypothetical protein